MLGTINLFCDASSIMMWVLVALVAVAIIVMPILNRKKQKEVNDILGTIDVGDEIMTVGGIMGKIVAIDKHESGEKLMIVETGEGEAKTTMTFSVRALSVNYTKTKLRQEQLEKQKAEKNKGKKAIAEPQSDEATQTTETADGAEETASTESSSEENK